MALRARYEENDWLNVLKPINDEMRSLQRNALVTYILHQMRADPQTAHIDTSDKLFEYFLMDVEMDPCMQTSRIRHALSSVQLFIERCLMNLEQKVAPSSIKAKQWQWMKRYRVWEANRKVFIWPENWLEPELRDGQSPFFKETMSELLQSDITEDKAATALLNYLSKLEEVAKLEPCGIHYVENGPEKADDIAHVVARTAGANRKYFYRRRDPSGWTPWEEIKLDIEDNPVIPVVWKGRLFLFWLRILKQAQPIADAPFNSGKTLAELEASDINLGAPKVIVQAILCWSEYYNGKWQPNKTSDIDHPAELGQYSSSGSEIFDRTTFKFVVFSESDGLRLVITGGKEVSFLFLNSHSLPLLHPPLTLKSWPGALYDNHFRIIKNDLSVSYYNSIPISLEEINRSLYSEFLLLYLNNPRYTRNVFEPLKNISPARIAEPWNAPLNRWKLPFFFEDSRHVFYVTTRYKPALFPLWYGYGVASSLPNTKIKIPEIVLPPYEELLDGIDPVVTELNIGDFTPIERLVSEDAYINKGIKSTETVPFGDNLIGAHGSLKGGNING